MWKWQASAQMPQRTQLSMCSAAVTPNSRTKLRIAASTRASSLRSPWVSKPGFAAVVVEFIPSPRDG